MKLWYCACCNTSLLNPEEVKKHFEKNKKCVEYLEKYGMSPVSKETNKGKNK